jgi:hypothetical protein
MSAKLVPTFADRGCRVVSATDPRGRVLGFLDRSRYYFYQVAPQLYSRVSVDPVPDPLLLRKYDSTGNRTRDLWICSQELWPPDHRGGQSFIIFLQNMSNKIVGEFVYTDHLYLSKCLFNPERTVPSQSTQIKQKSGYKTKVTNSIHNVYHKSEEEPLPNFRP